MTNYLTIFSGNNITINNIIKKIYNYIKESLLDAYLIIFVTYHQIYFQIIDKLPEKYVLLQNKAYTTHILFRFQLDKLNNNKLIFEYNFIEYELNDDNLSKIVGLYKNKYIINQQIQNMYYSSQDNGTYYIKGRTFGEIILEFEIKTNGLEDVYINFNDRTVGIDKLDSIVKMFNKYRRD
jgi:C-terminal processing protease CtpA/Prc